MTRGALVSRVREPRAREPGPGAEQPLSYRVRALAAAPA